MCVCGHLVLHCHAHTEVSQQKIQTDASSFTETETCLNSVKTVFPEQLISLSSQTGLYKTSISDHLSVCLIHDTSEDS